MSYICRKCQIKYTEDGYCEKCGRDLFDPELEHDEKQLLSQNVLKLNPYHRFVARMLDSLPFWILSTVLVEDDQFKWSINDLAQGNYILIALSTIATILIVFILYAFYETLFLRLFGATIGKLILGIKVVRNDGEALTVADAFTRFVKFWFLSLFFLNKFLFFINCWFIYKSGLKSGTTPWDRERYSVVLRSEIKFSEKVIKKKSKKVIFFATVNSWIHVFTAKVRVIPWGKFFLFLGGFILVASVVYSLVLRPMEKDNLIRKCRIDREREACQFLGEKLTR